MIYRVNTWTIPDSIGGEIRKKAMPWAKKMTKYQQEKWPEQEVEMLANYDGDRTEVHWKSKHESMAATEEWWKQLFKDDGIKSFMEELRNTEKETGNTPFFCQMRSHYYRIVDLD
jgi:hypothetical protein